MNAEKEMTALDTPIDADAEQSSETTNSISDNDINCNPFGEFFVNIDPSYMKTVTMQELYQNTYRKKPPIIDGLLCLGTYLFVGSPKIGKSFFMSQLAYHVSTGTPLWNYQVNEGTVLYLALEDDYRRLQERMYRMFGTDSTENLYFSVSSKYLGKGLTEQLTGFIKEHTNTSLVIIDTLQKIREVDSDSYSYAKDYEIINQLKQFSDSQGICLLLVHHTRKQKASDNFDMISGTNGLLGCADGAFMLYKESRTSNKAILEISGRDQQDQKIHLVRDEQKLCWNFEKAETQLWKEPPEPLLELIAKLVTEENPTWHGTATELIEKLGLDIKPNVVSLKLNVNASRLLNDYGIGYTNKRQHSGRMIFFLCYQRNDFQVCSVTMCDGRDNVL